MLVFAEYYSFALFHAAHLSTVAVIALLLTLYVATHRNASSKTKTHIERSLAFCCLASPPLNIALTFLCYSSVSLASLLPFHLCDLASIICGVALLTQSQRLFEIAYFWGLAATLQGLITPTISVDFPHPLFISFFWSHGFIVITALFLPIALGFRPRKKAFWRVFCITQLYAIFAICINTALGTNYGFLASKPQAMSLLDLLPQWPWYILFLESLALSLFYLLQLPFSKKSEK